MYGTGYDLGDYEGDDMDMGDMDGIGDLLQKSVMGVPAWGLALGGLALLALGTKAGRKMIGLGGKAKKNPRRKSRRRNRKMMANSVAVKANPRRRKNRRKSRRARR